MVVTALTDRRDRRVTPTYLVTEREQAGNNGRQAYRLGNLRNAWRWFRRYDDLMLLEISRG